MIRALLLCLLLCTQVATAKRTAPQNQAILNAYMKKCMKSVKLTKDKRQQLCRCTLDTLLKKAKVQDLKVLLKPAPELSEEDAAKVENVKEHETSMRNFEWDVMEDCLERLR